MEERKAFLLRISAELWKELETWAADELRSVNGQIEYLLRQAVQRRKGGVGDVGSSASLAKNRAAAPPSRAGGKAAG